MAWLAQLGPHTGYAAGVLGPLILAGLGMGMVISTAIATGTFGVTPQDAGVASATVTVGQQLGASIGTSLLNTIFAGAVTSYLAARHLAAARLTGRQALAGPAGRSSAAPCSGPGRWPGRARRPPHGPMRPPRQPRRPRPSGMIPSVPDGSP
jgi:hypothetical protein